MDQRKSTQENEIKRFWDNYIKRLEQAGIKTNVTRWYVIRAEQYIRTYPDKRLAEHGPEDVTAYFEKCGRTGGIAKRGQISG